mmetsp:Transcript_4019/g.8141  ORF Transcript_4019/g.8141 Transcript_4019/m.8141 type:complete len:199 (-) Transcript_4019:326-922(-)
MLHRMQAKYAEKPVRFLLFPVNQFGNQEPAPNADVKKFAESQSVSFAKNAVDGNVVMFAKSNLNDVPCSYSGADSCTPASAGCCPKNNGVYDYLLKVTPPHTIKWNFDKIIVGKDGRPYQGEEVLHGPDLDEKLSGIIDELLVQGSTAATELPASSFAGAQGLALLAAVAGAAALFAAWSAKARAKEEEVSENYILVA